MKEMAVVIAETKGGLSAVAEQSGYEIIPDTERQFSSLTTCSDPTFDGAGHIDTPKAGWVALAEYTK